MHLLATRCIYAAPIPNNLILLLLLPFRSLSFLSLPLLSLSSASPPPASCLQICGAGACVLVSSRDWKQKKKSSSPSLLSSSHCPSIHVSFLFLLSPHLRLPFSLSSVFFLFLVCVSLACLLSVSLFRRSTRETCAQTLRVFSLPWSARNRS